MNVGRTIVVEQADGVTTITLNRPEVLNAINPAMHEELQQAFDDFASDRNQLVCVLAGAGERAFCAGSDLKAGTRASGYRYPRCGYGGLVERFDLPKPIIASINGLALGGGFELALACDIIIASETAAFALPEPRVGAIAVGGGIDRLIRQMPQRVAMGYLLTGQRMSAPEAFGYGIVNAVVPPDSLAAEVQRWCRLILECSPMAIQTTKELARRSLAQPDLAVAISGMKDLPEYLRWWNSSDATEGVRAFVEKRAPIWSPPE